MKANATNAQSATIRLPRFTFINAPAGAGKTTLANLLGQYDVRLAHCSFAEPLRGALLATFYPEQMHLGIDLRDQEVKNRAIPGTNTTHRQWMVSYGSWLKSIFGPNIIGDLGRRMTEKLGSAYDRFVFDDARHEGDIRPFGLAYSPLDCLMIRIERVGTLWDQPPLPPQMGIKTVVVRNGSDPRRMLTQLASILGTWGDDPSAFRFPDPEVTVLTTETADIQRTSPSIGEL